MNRLFVFMRLAFINLYWKYSIAHRISKIYYINCQNSPMPLYMDIHVVDSEDFTVEEVVTAHMQDLAVQDRFGVEQIKYWVNEQQKTIFCLMKGPNKEACHLVHKESHGQTACNIIEVSDDEYNLYLGIGTSDNDLAKTLSGDVDTGYRTLLRVTTYCFSEETGNYPGKLLETIRQRGGVQIKEPMQTITASFVTARDALDCAMELHHSLAQDNKTECRISLLTGKPVDEDGTVLFGGALEQLESLNRINPGDRIYMDTDTKTLLEKETISAEVWENFKIIKPDELYFIGRFQEILMENLRNPEFNLLILNNALNLSKAQLYRKIKSVSNYGPGQLMQEIRLRKALELLQQNSRTIAEIGYDLGYTSPTYFTRAFRRRYNITPTQYQKIAAA